MEKPVRSAAAFDFDGTLIRGDSIAQLLLYGLKKGKISLLAALWSALAGGLYHMHLVGEMTAKRAGHGFLARMDAAERENFLQNFAGMICKKIRPQGLETIRKHQSQGDAVILCSASCACYMRHVARYLGVDALLCTPTDAQGQPQPPNCKRGEKVRLVEMARKNAQDLAQKRREQFVRQKARTIGACKELGSDISALRTAYGDSAGDVQMLSACKTPVLVHPKRALRRAFPQAERVSWPEPNHP